MHVARVQCSNLHLKGEERKDFSIEKGLSGIDELIVSKETKETEPL